MPECPQECSDEVSNGTSSQTNLTCVFRSQNCTACAYAECISVSDDDDDDDTTDFVTDDGANIDQEDTLQDFDESDRDNSDNTNSEQDNTANEDIEEEEKEEFNESDIYDKDCLPCPKMIPFCKDECYKDPSKKCVVHPQTCWKCSWAECISH